MPPRAASPPLPVIIPTTTSTKEPEPTLPLSADLLRPFTPRRSTDVSTPSTSNPLPAPTTLQLRPRNRSPFSRSHLRSHSSSSSLSAPLMTRAHSSPVVSTAGRVMMPTPQIPQNNPLSTPISTLRRRSPMRRATDDTYPTFNSSSALDISETISEKEEELELTPRGPEPTNPNSDPDTSNPPTSPLFPPHATFPRSRRRPASPLHHLTSPIGTSSLARTNQLRPSVSSPSLATLHNSNSTASSSVKYTESYPSYSSTSTSFSFSSSASMPSTPTSLRSRSPSISSLETIPDSPDAEEAALEAEQVARLKAAADRESDSGNEEGAGEGGREDGGGRRRNGGGAGLSGFAGGMMGYVGGGSRADKRKRWSVCGAERRGDLDLETIWED